MATRRSANLRLTLQDDDEFISLNKTTENFEKIDEAFGELGEAIEQMEGTTVIEAATLETVETADTTATRWGKVKKAIHSLISHLGAGGSAHTAATTSTAGFMSAADKEKLDTVQRGATAGGGSSYVHPQDLGNSYSLGLYQVALNSKGHVTSATLWTPPSAPVFRRGKTSCTVSAGELASNVVTVPLSGFSAAPDVQLTSYNGLFNVSINTVSASEIKFQAVGIDGPYNAAATFDVGWLAIGS